MKAEADVHAVQLEALLAVKRALTTEARWDSANILKFYKPSW